MRAFRKARSLALAGLAAALCALTPGAGAMADPAFEPFVTGLRDLCASPPATRCTRAVHGFLDMDGNGQIALGEIEAVHSAASVAVQARETAMTTQERSLVGIALLGLKYADPSRVFANFDANGDGGVSHGELFTDFRLDGRPFAELVEDRDAVDWESFANRFGKLGQAFVAMLPPAADTSSTEKR